MVQELLEGEQAEFWVAAAVIRRSSQARVDRLTYLKVEPDRPPGGGARLALSAVAQVNPNSGRSFRFVVTLDGWPWLPSPSRSLPS